MPVHSGTCLTCNEPFQRESCIPPKYCSKKCKPRGVNPRTAECCVCRIVFTHFQGNREQATCSLSCGAKLGSMVIIAKRVMTGLTEVEIMAPLNWRQCGDCGTEWLSKGRVGGATYCRPCIKRRNTDISSAVYYERTADLGPRGARVRQCTVCGMTFTTPHAGNRQCSQRCKNRTPAAMANRRDGKARRRARMRGVETERVRSKDVFTRDGFMCLICHKPLNMEVKAPHPKSPTIDHIIPLAHDGPHTMGNVRAAHFLCNSKRGTNYNAQIVMNV